VEAGGGRGEREGEGGAFATSPPLAKPRPRGPRLPRRDHPRERRAPVARERLGCRGPAERGRYTREGEEAQEATVARAAVAEAAVGGAPRGSMRTGGSRRREAA
jgi:hypothetical protein